MLLDYSVKLLLLRRQTTSSGSLTVTYLLEFCTRILPLILVQTVLADYAPWLLSTMLILSIVFITMAYYYNTSVNNNNNNSGEPFPLQLMFSPATDAKIVSLADSARKKTFLSEYRSLVMIGTCVAILAVDFNVFPRRLAKTELFGYSLVRYL